MFVLHLAAKVTSSMVGLIVNSGLISIGVASAVTAHRGGRLILSLGILRAHRPKRNYGKRECDHKSYYEPRGFHHSAFLPIDHLDRKSTRLNSSHSQISYAV